VAARAFRPRPRLLGGISPTALTKHPHLAKAPRPRTAVQGVAEGGAIIDNRTSQARTRRVSTVIVAPRPCGRSGSRKQTERTTCIGIPDRSPNLSRTR